MTDEEAIRDSIENLYGEPTIFEGSLSSPQSDSQEL